MVVVMLAKNLALWIVILYVASHFHNKHLFFLQYSTIPSECNLGIPTSKADYNPLSSDSFGNLIAEQVLWKIPGIDHLAHGVDFFSGQEAPALIFDFTYCNSENSKVIHDMYRGNSYHMPYQVC